MRLPYERPVLQKLHLAGTNKFGANPAYARRVRGDIDGVAVADLVERFGSPLFVFSEKRLRRRYREVETAFSTRYPNVRFAWSYKTNYLSALCAILHQEGAAAEVVSGLEYAKARALGVPGRDIIFNGPLKRPAELERAVGEGALINIDHSDEIADLEALARRLGQPIAVGLRLNMDTGIQPQWSRFGFNLESGQAFDAARRLRATGLLKLTALHCHIGTYVMEPRAYGVAAGKLADFAARLEKELGFSIDLLDIGGGLPSNARLKGAWLPPEIALAPVDDYAEKITEALFAMLPPGRFPRLVCEAGRAIIDEAGFLITTVHAAKRLPDGRRGYVLDAGINLLYTAPWFRFTLELERDVQGPNEPTVLYGPLCMNIDVVEEATMLPALPRGLRLVLSPVGAYSVTQSLQFIQARPAMVLVGEDGGVELIRAAEDLSDLDRREHVPDRLRPSF